MAIADVTIIPIGTETPSVSAYVADVQRIVRRLSTRRENQISTNTNEYVN